MRRAACLSVLDNRQSLSLRSLRDQLHMPVDKVASLLSRSSPCISVSEDLKYPALFLPTLRRVQHETFFPLRDEWPEDTNSTRGQGPWFHDPPGTTSSLHRAVVRRSFAYHRRPAPEATLTADRLRRSRWC